MKRKILNIFLVVVLIIGLTGCSYRTRHKEIVNANYSVLIFSDKYKIMIVDQGDKSDIINYEGKKIGTIERYLYGKKLFISNNYIYTNDKISNSNGFNYINDYTGKEVYKVQGAITGISESGYALVEEEKSNMKIGDFTEYNIIDLKNGSSVFTINSKEATQGFVYAGYKDYFLQKELSVSLSGTLIDAKTLNKYKEYSSNEDYLKKESVMFRGYKAPYTEKMHEPGTRNDIVSLEKGLFFYDSKLYDLSGKELKDLSEGEVKTIVYYNGNILVITYTNYVYILDENMNYILKPMKMSDTDIDRKYERVINEYSVGSALFTTTKGYFALSIYGGDKKAKIQILDNNTLKEVKKLEIGVENSDSNIMITQNGLLVNSNDGNAYIITKDKETKYENSKIKGYSDNFINIFSNGVGSIINLNTLEKLTY